MSDDQPDIFDGCITVREKILEYYTLPVALIAQTTQIR